MLTAIVVVFCVGYAAIAFEHRLGINKAASALLMGITCWTLYALDVERLMPVDRIPESFVTETAGEVEPGELPRLYATENQILHLTGEIAYILFFLMGAMTIVELVDAHNGFSVVTDRIRPHSKLGLLWAIAWLAFFLSAVLDNLTTTIVMVSLMRKLVAVREDRLMFAGIIVIAANAGGAWTVIGDITTTMLWIKHKIGTTEVMSALFLPSIACLLVPLIGLSFRTRGPLATSDSASTAAGVTAPGHPFISHQATDNLPAEHTDGRHRVLFLCLGIVGLLSVPVFKAITHLPPYTGMLLALSVLWIVSELIDRNVDQQLHSVSGALAALKRIDMSAVLFFLGILLAVGALAATGLLTSTAERLRESVPDLRAIAVVIGLVSAVVDNVPLVAAGIEMYTEPTNSPFWMLLAYCAGTGGSCLIIGSAAGVAAMGLERIDFLWYLRRMTPWALLGYFSGIGVFLLQQSLTR